MHKKWKTGSEVKMRKGIWILALGLIGLTACRTVVPQAASVVGESPTAVATLPADPPTAAPELSSTADAPTADASTAVDETAEPGALADPVPAFPPPIAVQPALSREPVGPDQLAAAAELAATVPPARDDMRLAQAYRGLTAVPEPAKLATPYAVGDRESFNVPDVVNNLVNTIDAQLYAVSDHAYFWFDTGPNTFVPDAAGLERAAAEFDLIYDDVIRHFGPEDNPGIDGDARVHIVHAASSALCGTVGGCVAGLVNSVDTVPALVDPRSNEREMFVMNIDQFDSDFYYGVLAHEFRHMIEDNYDDADTDWEKEGSATLAAELLGLPSGALSRGTQFLSAPDQQLNSWTDDGTAPYYGMGYLLSRYVFDQLGEDLYREIAMSPLPGLLAVEQVARANGRDLTADDIWFDWQTALALIGAPGTPPEYRFESTGMPRAAATAVNSSLAGFETTVQQYAADYYDLPEDQAVTVSFTGSTQAPLIGTIPASGASFWYAQRANGSNPRLTRTVDLRDVSSATLNYSVFSDIEEGYDFGYVAVSTDGGQVWQPLTAANMQGLEPTHNPAGSAFTERFYTGRGDAWVSETVDLTPFAGQEILLRFEYVTDAILTYGGFAIDDISIPEIGFYDDAESLDAGWQAEGFTRATAYLPQNWHLRLITFENGVPVVQDVALSEDQTAVFDVPAGDGSGRAMLIVAASAPLTLEPAHYGLDIE